RSWALDVPGVQPSDLAWQEAEAGKPLPPLLRYRVVVVEADEHRARVLAEALDDGGLRARDSIATEVDDELRLRTFVTPVSTVCTVGLPRRWGQLPKRIAATTPGCLVLRLHQRARPPKPHPGRAATEATHFDGAAEGARMVARRVRLLLRQACAEA